MEYKPFSKKQLQALSWWKNSKYKNYNAIICDGAVRSGKTFSLSLSFVLWAFSTFDGGLFGLCGKTIKSLRRNVVIPLLPILKELGFSVKDNISSSRITVSDKKKEITLILFSGKDESSASLIQGVTLSGVLFDEVALMPRSFVEQALARCSVSGSKFFFNCNPEYPYHWFYKEWIKKCDDKRALYIHFTMRDNPSLSDEMISRYESLYSGAFYRRFVKGEWVSVSGAVYPFMDSSMFCPVPVGEFHEFVVSCDYGTVNPSSFGLWGRKDFVWYRIDEYYFDSKKEGVMRTDEEHYDALISLIGERSIEAVIVDPSAKSFIEVIKRKGKFVVMTADNNVLDGIRKTSSALKEKRIVICDNCEDAKREFSLYRWDEKKSKDTVLKENDHAMDDIRYFVTTYLENGDSCFAIAAKR